MDYMIEIEGALVGYRDFIAAKIDQDKGGEFLQIDTLGSHRTFRQPDLGKIWDAMKAYAETKPELMYFSDGPAILNLSRISNVHFHETFNPTNSMEAPKPRLKINGVTYLEGPGANLVWYQLKGAIEEAEVE